MENNNIQNANKRRRDFPLENDRQIVGKKKFSSSTISSQLKMIKEPLIPVKTALKYPGGKPKKLTKVEKKFKINFNADHQKAMEEEQSLCSELEKLKIINEENKVTITNEFIEKNLQLLQLDALIKHHEEMKKLIEMKTERIKEKTTKILATKESVLMNVEKSKNLIDGLNTKKINLTSQIEVRDQEILREQARVN
jgi:hypothetical protein